jgi:hypothetical protein
MKRTALTRGLTSLAVVGLCSTAFLGGTARADGSSPNCVSPWDMPCELLANWDPTMPVPRPDPESR